MAEGTDYKSANQMWRESGSDKSFSEWIDEAKNAGGFIPDANLMQGKEKITFKGNEVNEMRNATGNGIDDRQRRNRQYATVLGITAVAVIAYLAFSGKQTRTS